MKALNTKVELEKEGGGRRGAEDEKAYPTIVDLISIIKTCNKPETINTPEYSSSLLFMLSQVKLCFGGIHEAKTVVEL